jgi:MoxR-like ATPase
MNPAKLHGLLITAIRSNRRVLIKGKPGIGKSDIVAQATAECGADIVLEHPSISDPTDYKGMPALTAGGAEAHFLPFGNLSRLCRATKPTVCFLDDIGQAAPAVQAALMQLVLARAVNGTRISDSVVFLGATNDTAHLAGVSGMIEPLKSRWDSIVELEVSIDDWSNWALDNAVPAELLAFLRFRPALLSDFKPTKELRNSPSPRGWASVGRWMDSGVRDLEVFAGAVGEGAAVEFISFLDMYASLPSLDAILLDPANAEVPTKPGALFAVASGLARKATSSTLERVTTYTARLPKEFDVMCIRDAVRMTKGIAQCPAFVTWATRNSSVLI